jgi:CNT family concentrative nucleoside transporter
VVFLKFPPAAKAFLLLNDGVEALQKATDAGTGLVFGYLGGAPLPFTETPSRRLLHSSPSARCRWCW